MAAVVPIVATMFSAGGVAAGISAIGAGLAGAAGVAGFLTSAGTILGAVGAITGNKKLGKVAALMSLGGGLMGGFGASANAASGSGAEGAFKGAGDFSIGEGGASGAWDAAGSAAGSDAGMLSRYGNLGQSAGDISSTLASGGSLAPAMPGMDFGGSMPGMDMGGGADFSNLAGFDPSAPTTLGADMGSAFDPQSANGSIFSRALEQQNPIAGGEFNTPSASQSVMSPTNPAATSSNPAQLVSKQPGLLDRLAQKTGSMSLNDILKFAKENKELVSLGGQMLYGMYGPQAEAMDEQRSIMARRLSNMNSPVKLGVRRPALAGMG